MNEVKISESLADPEINFTPKDFQRSEQDQAMILTLAKHFFNKKELHLLSRALGKQSLTFTHDEYHRLRRWLPDATKSRFPIFYGYCFAFDYVNHFLGLVETALTFASKPQLDKLIHAPDFMPWTLRDTGLTLLGFNVKDEVYQDGKSKKTIQKEPFDRMLDERYLLCSPLFNAASALLQGLYLTDWEPLRWSNAHYYEEKGPLKNFAAAATLDVLYQSDPGITWSYMEALYLQNTSLPKIPEMRRLPVEEKKREELPIKKEMVPVENCEEKAAEMIRRIKEEETKKRESLENEHRKRMEEEKKRMAESMVKESEKHEGTILELERKHEEETNSLVQTQRDEKQRILAQVEQLRQAAAIELTKKLADCEKGKNDLKQRLEDELKELNLQKEKEDNKYKEETKQKDNKHKEEMKHKDSKHKEEIQKKDNTIIQKEEEIAEKNAEIATLKAHQPNQPQPKDDALRAEIESLRNQNKEKDKKLQWQTAVVNRNREMDEEVKRLKVEVANLTSSIQKETQGCAEKLSQQTKDAQVADAARVKRIKKYEQEINNKNRTIHELEVSLESERQQEKRVPDFEAKVKALETAKERLEKELESCRSQKTLSLETKNKLEEEIKTLKEALEAAKRYVLLFHEETPQRSPGGVYDGPYPPNPYRQFDSEDVSSQSLKDQEAEAEAEAEGAEAEAISISRGGAFALLYPLDIPNRQVGQITPKEYETLLPASFRLSEGAEATGISKSIYLRYAKLQLAYLQIRDKIKGDATHSVTDLRPEKSVIFNCPPEHFPVFMSKAGKRLTEKEAHENPNNVDLNLSYCERAIPLK